MRYLDRLLSRYLGLGVPATARLAEVDPFAGQGGDQQPLLHLPPGAGRVGLEGGGAPPDVIILNGDIHYEEDIQALFDRVRSRCGDQTRLMVVFYNALWRPFFALATWLGVRRRLPPDNWVSAGDVDNFLTLAGFERIRRERKVLLPLPVPLLAWFLNRWLAPLPGIGALCLLTIVVARRRPVTSAVPAPSVSIVIPARNEAGNIAALVERIPRLGPDDEIILIEGHSTDGTWAAIEEVQRQAKGRRVLIARQDGKGKGDAVRKGFAMAGREILMILDADLSVPPEELPKFHRALVGGVGEFINGSRLVYPMERRAMRFFNLLGNLFFALGFSFVLGQRFKDTLCGTKVLWRRDYLHIAEGRSYFGDFDPFGDFDLIFGAARFGLKIVEVPVHYKARTYGDTNISRWRHGCILLAMLAFGARKIRFV